MMANTSQNGGMPGAEWSSEDDDHDEKSESLCLQMHVKITGLKSMFQKKEGRMWCTIGVH